MTKNLEVASQLAIHLDCPHCSSSTYAPVTAFKREEICGDGSEVTCIACKGSYNVRLRFDIVEEGCVIALM